MKHLLTAWSLALLLSGCGKSDDGSSSTSDTSGDSGSSSGSSNGDQPWDDPAKPYLTDQKMGSFIESLKDSNGPFDAVSKGKVTAFNATGRMNEFEAAAKKHGFASGAEYLGAWMRINGVNAQIMQEDSNQMMIKSQEELIRNTEEALKAPDLAPEMRKSHEERIQGLKESLAAFKQPREGAINAKDVETFKKHRAAFEEAMKKWTK